MCETSHWSTSEMELSDWSNLEGCDDGRQLNRKEIDFYTHHKLCTRIHYAVNGNENMNLIHTEINQNKTIYFEFFFCIKGCSRADIFI